MALNVYPSPKPEAPLERLDVFKMPQAIIEEALDSLAVLGSPGLVAECIAAQNSLPPYEPSRYLLDWYARQDRFIAVRQENLNLRITSYSLGVIFGRILVKKLCVIHNELPAVVVLDDKRHRASRKVEHFLEHRIGSTFFADHQKLSPELERGLKVFTARYGAVETEFIIEPNEQSDDKETLIRRGAIDFLKFSQFLIDQNLSSKTTRLRRLVGKFFRKAGYQVSR